MHKKQLTANFLSHRISMGSSETPSMAIESLLYQNNSKQSVEETSEVSTMSPKTAIIIKENSSCYNH